jgi:hypothetical protein
MCRSSRPSCFAVFLDLLAQDFLGSGLMAGFVEFESASALRAIDGPAGEDAGHLGDVGLGVAAVDAEGVQFHQLAGIVFVQAFGSFLRLRWGCGVALLFFSAAGESGPMLLELSR